MSRARSLLAFHAVRTEGGLLPQDILQRIALEDKALPGLTPDAYNLSPGERLRDAVNRAWSRLTVAWRTFQTELAKLKEGDRATTVTRKRWLLPFFKELDFGQLNEAPAVEIEGKRFSISHTRDSVPIHLVGCGVDLDTRDKQTGGSPHGLVQDFLNRSDAHLWGFVSNGYILRVLRDHHSLTQQAYVEFDLQAIMEGEAFSEFLLLWLLCHQSRVEGTKPEECWLEKWFGISRDEGVRALEQLRAGVEKAITALGTGFLKLKQANKTLHQKLESGDLDKQDYYRQILRLAYRLIFLFVAEDRGALLDPRAPEAARARYEAFYTTRRLRELADKRRGGPHGDLWQQLRLVMNKVENGSPELGLPALGSFLWSERAIWDLNGLELANEDLLGALRALCYTEQGKARYPVSWRNMGAEELGSVYESLLELHPNIHKEAGRFELSTAVGHERKTTGSYYTPTSLVDCLLDSALEPVLDEAAKKPDPEKAILDLKVCDPACGSGHFLVAAARRMAIRLARVRAGGEEPSPPEVQRALRDVVGRCVYGVDLNPMAVELCKVSLWMEAIEPGKPLSFLEGHIREGNALLGATPALMANGIPDEAFEPIEGDDKEVAKRLKKRNKKARETGQGTLFAGFAAGAPVSYYGRITTAAERVEEDKDDDIGAVRKKEEDWEQFTASEDYKKAMFLADAWCAAFVWPKQKGVLEDGAITEDLWRRMEQDPKVAPAATRREANGLAREYSFLHWHLAFPQVLRPKDGPLASDDPCGWEGGFDLVLGNPPWDTLSPDAKEFFSRYDARVRFQAKAEQDASLSELLKDDAIAAAWARNRRNLFATAFFLKDSGRYTLFAPGNLGKGDFNVYRMFVEIALRSVRDGGRAAQIVPDGLYGGANSMAIRKKLFEQFRLDWLLGFENARETWFAGVDSRAKFTLYSARSGGITEDFRAAFCIRSADELRGVMAGASMNLPVAMVREFSPETLAVMEFRGQCDIDIARKMYQQWPPLGRRVPGTAHREFLRELESGHVQEFLTEDPSGLPHYEGRMIAHYDHLAKGYQSGRARAAVWVDLPFGSAGKIVRPQWYVSRDKVPVQARERIKQYRVAFCDVASPTNERTLVASVIPPNCIAGAKVPTVLMQSQRPTVDLLLWLAVANSFTMDFLVRMKVSLTMALTILDSLPFPRLSPDDPRTRRLTAAALRLVCTGPEMIGLWNLLANDGLVQAVSVEGPAPGIIDAEERQRIVAEIEADVAMLYGLTAREVDYIMETFPIVKRKDIAAHGTYRTKDIILDIYDRMQRAIDIGEPEKNLPDPPPADPRVAHPPRKGTS